MFTDKNTLIKIQTCALKKATEEWTTEERTNLSKDCFSEVVIDEYRSKIEYPSMDVRIKVQ